MLDVLESVEEIGCDRGLNLLQVGNHGRLRQFRQHRVYLIRGMAYALLFLPQAAKFRVFLL